MTRIIFVFLFLVFVMALSASIGDDSEQVDLKCPEDEVEDYCPSKCYNDKCPNKENYNQVCNMEGCGPPRCKCRFNMKRAANGTCIDTASCPPFTCDRPNEEYIACPPYCPKDDCDEASSEGLCSVNGLLLVAECEPACRCIKGYWRKNGVCVPFSECLKKCPKNEEFSICPQSIKRAQYCSERGQSSRQLAVDDESCKRGCVCKKGPTTCGPNEIQDNCPANCESNYCPTSNNSDNSLCTTPDVCPPPVCKCRFNYRRAINGTCIPTKNCPPFDCSSKPNEEFVSCPPLCPTDDCSQASPTGKCPALFGNIGIVLTCNPKCRCINGYWRLNGTCVPYGQCPGVCPKNERYSECIQGECRALNCTQIAPTCSENEQLENCSQSCTSDNCPYSEDQMKNEVCSKSDTCIPRSDLCAENEEYSPCTQRTCRPENCSDRNSTMENCSSVDDELCERGCVCKENFYRNDEGNCVPSEECEAPSCPTNEEFVPCVQGVCRAMNCWEKSENVSCPEIPEDECDSGCVCKENYLRAENGTCVPEDTCQAVTCPPNEEFSSCSQAVCRAFDCKERGQPIPCPMILEGSCIKECICKYGYLRDENGDCIPEETCPPPFDCSDRPNEEYHPCPPICPSDACSKPRLTGHCPFNIKTVLNCQPKCQCKDGYGRVNGTCTCSNRNSTVANCSNCDDTECQRGCVCKENFYRNDDGACVPSEECEDSEDNNDSSLCTGPNEHYTKEFQSCPPNICKSLMAKYKCNSTEPAKPGCLCDSGYFRLNLTSPCIPKCECPEMANSPDCLK
ncbi:hypothetical protein HF086_014827 [Spodoptera exigua]|uniref:TIL domain-containing protein n=1 Tax=Spodoptera exigua TaxID=7107 RepID=A0A922M2L8_SPOEX|nr:hypothetical protein HF086_014827 [Spodoptera exigua]